MTVQSARTSAASAPAPQAPAAPGQPASPRTRIGRQGIYDRSGALAGHELLFRGVESDRSGLADGTPVTGPAAARVAAAGDHATSQVISATFGDFGLSELSDGRPLFINMTRSFLVGDLPVPFGPQGVVLEVLENIVVDDELLAGLALLRGRGFTIAVDDFAGEPERQPLLPHADIVKVNLRDPRLDLAAVVEVCRRLAPDAQLVAEGIEDADVLTRAQESGFGLFQGYHFQRPALLQTARLAPSQVVCLRLLRALNDPSSSTRDIEDVVAADPGLSLRVLRTANSAGNGSRRPISSLRQAVVLLGPPALRAWVLLALMGGLTAGRRDDLVTILARAACCEAIAAQTDGDPGAAYTTGLLSGVAQVLRTDVRQVAAGAGIGPEVVEALVDGTGHLGGVLRAVEAHELDRNDAADLCGVTPFELSRTYLESWSTAIATVSGTLDG